MDQLRALALALVALLAQLPFPAMAGALRGPAAEVINHPLQQVGLGSISAVAASADARYFASAGPSGVYLWDWVQTKPLRRWEQLGTRVVGVGFSPDGQVLAAADRDASLRAWSTETGQALWRVEAHQLEITRVLFSPDGRRVVSTSGDNTARLWDAATGALVREFKLPGSWFQDAAFSSDGRLLVTCQSDPHPEPRVWDVETGTVLRLLSGHTAEARRVVGTGGNRVATSGLDRTLRLWDLTTGKVITSLNLTQELVHLAVNERAGRLLGSEAFGALPTWDLETLAPRPAVPGIGSNLNGLAAGPGEGDVFVATTDERLELRDLASGAVLRDWPGHHSSTLPGLSITADAKTIYAGGVDAATRAWDVESGREVRRFPGHPGGTSVAELSPDGRRLVTTRGFPRPTAVIWNVETGEVERELTGHTGWLLKVALSPDGTTLATVAQDGTARTWEVATGRALLTLRAHAGNARSVAFSPDGRLLATGGDDESVRLWKLPSGEPSRRLASPGAPIKEVAFAPSGHELVTASEDGRLRFWDPATGAALRQWSVPGGFLNSVRYSPDGARLVTGEGWPFFAARVWSVSSGDLLRVFGGNTLPVEAAIFTADGTRVVTAADAIRVWDLGDLALRLEHVRQGNAAEMRWTQGMLQSAADPAGPWEDVPGATSPWTPTTVEDRRFYRVRVDAAGDGDGRR